MTIDNDRPAPLRVAFICGADLSAPSEKQALWLASELIRNGHAALLSLRGDPRTVNTQEVDPGAAPEIVWHAFRGRRPTKATLQAVRVFRPTHFHAWSARVPAVTLAKAYSAATHRPVFFHWEDNEWHLMKTVSGSGMRSFKHAVKRTASALHPPAWHFATQSSLSWATRHGIAFDALTPALADAVEAQTGRECTTVFPASPLEAWGAASSGKSIIDREPGVKIGLFTGDIHFAREPDIRYGLTAIGMAQKAGLPLHFAHAGRNTLGIDLDRLATECGMAAGTTRSLGVLPFASIPAALREADVLIEPGLPSDFNRLRLPSKLQAYLASGVPVVTFGCGFGALLNHGQDALLTQGSDPAELAAALRQVVADSALRRRLAQHAPETARRLFDPAANAADMVEHYRRHLSGGDQPS